MKRMLMATLALGCAAPPLAQAQPALPTTVIHAGALLATPGAPPLAQQTVIVRGDRIAEVRPGFVDPKTVARDARLVDLSGKFVMPGMMDMHTHLGFNLSRPRTERTLAEQAPLSKRFLEASLGARYLLQSGFTTIRGAGDQPELIFVLRDAIQAGQVEGPRIFASGPAIARTGGHGYGDCDGEAACRAITRKRISEGADWVKMATSGGASDETGDATSDADLFPDEIEAVVKSARKLKRDVMVHATSTQGVNAALRGGARSIEHANYADAESFRLFKETGAYMSPTTYVVDFLDNNETIRRGMSEAEYAQLTQTMKTSRALPSRAWRAGVKMVIATDAGNERSARHAREFALYVESGVPAAEAIKAGTLNAAELLRKDKDLGQIRPGFLADIIGVDGDPLKDISRLEHVDFVMKGGAVYRQDNRPVARPVAP